jgi:hypothetical protein
MPSPTKTRENVSLMISRLLSGPARPGQTFAMPGCSYGDLYGLARRMRFFFNDHADVDRPFCLCSEDRTIMAAALLASLAGGPPLLMPHALSPAALDELQRMTGFTHAIAAPRDLLPAGTTNIDADALADEVETLASDEEPDPDRPWVYLFTGGSTGIPQLWSKTPGNLLGEVAYLVDRYAVGSGDRILATVTAMHIYGLLYSLLLPLAASSRVVAQTPSFPEEIKRQMAQTSPTIFVSVPVHYRTLKDNPPDAGAMRVAFSSAGPLAEADGVAFSEATGVDLVEIYGSTETGGIATRCRAAGEVCLTPYQCIQWRVAGDSLDIRSAFLSGELPIRDSGWFTMSDRVKRYGSDGFVVAGRVDSIVKVGGNRVDLEKIRRALLDIDAVDDAQVLANPVETGRSSEIVALVVSARSVGDLRKDLDGVLEPHEKPRRLLQVDRVPMTSAGKVDRRAIESLVAAHPIDDEPGASTVTPDEADGARRHPIAPMVRRLTVTDRLPEPKAGQPPQSLVDRLAEQMDRPVAVPTDLTALRCLAAYRGSRQAYTVVLHEEAGIRRILEGTQPASFGLAVDLGTTSITGSLCDLRTGARLSIDTCANPQSRIGKDVISRIVHANGGRENLGRLQRMAAEGINRLIARCLEKVDAPVEAVDEVVICGNTAMQQILSGLSCNGLGDFPYSPVTLTPPLCYAADLGLTVDPTVSVCLMPVVSGFVGGDTMAALLAERPHEREKMTLIVDIGVNNEVILGNRDGLWAAGCPADPAVEEGRMALGRQIEFLMRAAGIQSIDRTVITGITDGRSAGLSAPDAGTLPTDLPLGRIVQKSNLAGEGVVMALLDKNLRSEARDLCRRVRFLELAAKPEFAMQFAGVAVSTEPIDQTQG